MDPIVQNLKEMDGRKIAEAFNATWVTLILGGKGNGNMAPPRRNRVTRRPPVRDAATTAIRKCCLRLPRIQKLSQMRTLNTFAFEIILHVDDR